MGFWFFFYFYEFQPRIFVTESLIKMSMILNIILCTKIQHSRMNSYSLRISYLLFFEMHLLYRIKIVGLESAYFLLLKWKQSSYVILKNPGSNQTKSKLSLLSINESDSLQNQEETREDKLLNKVVGCLFCCCLVFFLIYGLCLDLSLHTFSFRNSTYYHQFLWKTNS